MPFFTADAILFTGLDVKNYQEYVEKATRNFMRVAVRRFVTAAVARIPIRTGFVRGAFTDLEQSVGAGGATSKVSSISKKLEKHTESLKRHKENLAKVQADIVTLPPSNIHTVKTKEALDIERKLNKLKEKHSEGEISDRDYIRRAKKLDEQLEKIPKVQAVKQETKQSFFQKIGGKNPKTFEEKRTKVLERLEKLEKFHTERISKLQERIADLTKRHSKFTATGESKVSPFELHIQGSSTPRSLPEKISPAHARSQGAALREAIKNRQRPAHSAGGLVEYYYVSKKERILKTFRSGTTFAHYEFGLKGNVYYFKFEIDISYFNVQDVTRNRYSGPSAPWGAFEAGRRAMLDYLKKGKFAKKLTDALFQVGFLKKTRFTLTSQGIRQIDFSKPVANPVGIFPDLVE